MASLNNWPPGISQDGKKASRMASISRSRCNTYTGVALIILDKNLGRPGPHHKAERGRQRLRPEKLVKTLPALRRYSHTGGQYVGGTTEGTDEWIIMILREESRSPRWKRDLHKVLKVIQCELDNCLLAIRMVKAEELPGSHDIHGWMKRVDLDEAWVYDMKNTLQWIRAWCPVSPTQSTKAGWSLGTKCLDKIHETAMQGCVVFQNVTGTTWTRSPRLRLDIELENFGLFHKLLLDRTEQGESVL